MFGSLTQKLQGAFRKLVGTKTLSEDNLKTAVREIRLALLEADVQYSVTKTFVQRVKERVLGQEVLKTVSPSEQFTKVVHDELADLMGEGEAGIAFRGGPAVILLCGLQGSGKTTSSVKLARFLEKKPYSKRCMIAACDLQRPAAVQQLKTLGEQANIPICSIDAEKCPIKVAKAALKQARGGAYDVLIVDTAGRLHVDDALMKELSDLKALLDPCETLFVANSTLGQDAVNSAREVHDRIGLTGTILTMLDGDARGGAAISIREVTGQPLKFEGIGERLEDFQPFNPQSMADRILGMGDVINLVKSAQEHVSEDEARRIEKRIRKAGFTYEDYLQQMRMVKKMGSMKRLLKMLPIGIPNEMLDGFEGEFGRIEAMILSMTPKERTGNDELVMSRRRRIARGSGRSLDDVNRLIKGFRRAKQFCKQTRNQRKLESLLGGTPAWQ